MVVKHAKNTYEYPEVGHVSKSRSRNGAPPRKECPWATQLVSIERAVTGKKVPSVSDTHPTPSPRKKKPGTLLHGRIY